MSIGHFAAATRRIDSSWDPLFLIRLGEPGNKLEEPRQCLWRWDSWICKASKSNTLQSCSSFLGCDSALCTMECRATAQLEAVWAALLSLPSWALPGLGPPNLQGVLASYLNVTCILWQPWLNTICMSGNVHSVGWGDLGADLQSLHLGMALRRVPRAQPCVSPIELQLEHVLAGDGCQSCTSSWQRNAANSGNYAPVELSSRRWTPRGRFKCYILNFFCELLRILYLICFMTAGIMLRTGGPMLKGTQKYPEGFGRFIARKHVDVRDRVVQLTVMHLWHWTHCTWQDKFRHEQETALKAAAARIRNGTLEALGLDSECFIASPTKRDAQIIHGISPHR